MPRRGDTELVDAVAREAGLTRGERVAFGGTLEAAKAAGEGGTRNLRGDFTREELRAEASVAARARAVDRSLDAGSDRRAAERRVAALVGERVERAGTGLGLTTCELELRSARWVLRRDYELIATSSDEDLGALVGLTVTAASMRRRDAALALTFDETHELQVRAPRRGQGWALGGIHVHG